MAKIAGCDVLLKVAKDSGSGSPSSYTVIGGQTGATLNRSAETIDVTDKTNEGYKEYMAGLKEWSVDCEGFVVLEDNGIKILDEVFEQRKKVFLEIVMGGRKYTGSGYITDYPIEMPLDSAVSYSLSISGASPLVAGEASSS